ncbi:MAG: hypothetical protein DRN17_06055 [Thermoplasmata archaeon]|nr:MAG: hypothetical protein DRN17_06055 [Thermoplasmata archaeon]
MIFDFIDGDYIVSKLKKLDIINEKFPDAAALSDSLANPTTTIVGSALLGFDGSVWERLRTDGSGRLLIWLG